MNDPEEQYAEGIEREGEIFLEGLQNKKDIGELEKEYSKKVKEIRRIYEKSLRKELEKEHNSQKVKNKADLEIKEEKEFRVQNLNLEKSWGERKQIEVASSKYRMKRKIKNTLSKILPNFLIYLYYKTKRILKDGFKEVKGFLKRRKEKTLEKIINTFTYIKEGLLIVVSSVKKVLNLLKKKKKEENIKDKEKNKEDGSKNTKKRDK